MRPMLPKRTYPLFLWVTAGLLATSPIRAHAEDPPGRVARLNLIQGSVSLQTSGSETWVVPDPNRPLTVGDNLWSEDGRSELHLGSTLIRLSSRTGISFLNLDDRAVQIHLAQGTLAVRIRDLRDDEAYEIDTPNLALTLLRPGEYRVAVDSSGKSTTVTIRRGSAEATGGGSTYNLERGEQGVFSGSTPLSYDGGPAPDPDGFEKWCAARDRHEDLARSASYISRDVIGYEDLDAYGTWRADPIYGSVWVPSVSPAWAPYHYGHWVYIAPWGWTWVDEMPWGFAPFHYGRWAYGGAGWIWVPGSVAVVAGAGYVRPIYAPALVGFVGGRGVSVSVALGGGIAGVAWIPLGPRDVWVPGYAASPTYVQNVNISNSRVINRTEITNVYNTSNTSIRNSTYTNQNLPGAVTAVPKESFTGGRSASVTAVNLSAEQIEHPQVLEKTPVAPTLQSHVGPSPAATALPPTHLANRPVVMKMAPAPQAVPIGHIQLLPGTHLPRSGAAALPSNKLVSPSNPGPELKKPPAPQSAHKNAVASSTPAQGKKPDRAATGGERTMPPGKQKPKPRPQKPEHPKRD